MSDSAPEIKVCAVCALPLPWSDFLAHGKTCKRCRLKQQIAFRQAQIDEIDKQRAESQRAYRDNDRKLLATGREG